MKLVKNVLLILVAFILLAVVISFFLSGKVHVERSLAVKADHQVIFDQVNTIKNWDNWQPWNKMDPNWKVEYFGPPSGIGAGYKWQSANKNVGSGQITIMTSTPDSIVVEMNFGEMGISYGKYIFTKEGDSYLVKQTIDSDMGSNPMAKYMGLMMDKMIGKEFEKGLHSIKEIAESAPKAMPADSTQQMAPAPIQ